MHDKTSTAWMVRRDGKAIPCVQHIYADSSELDEALYNVEEEYQNSMDKDSNKSERSYLHRVCEEVWQK